MSHYTTRWCAKHDEWDDDVDHPSEGCPKCIEDGSFKPRAHLERELTQLREELEAALHCVNKAGMQGCTPAQAIAFLYQNWKAASEELTESQRRLGKLREYAQHKFNCGTKLRVDNECNCGLAEVMK